MEAIEDSFHAIQITPGMWIVPGKADITDPDAVNILLAPGAAFGTGELLPLLADPDWHACQQKILPDAPYFACRPCASTCAGLPQPWLAQMCTR